LPRVEGGEEDGEEYGKSYLTESQSEELQKTSADNL
jgi:hypothetical protein